MIEIIPAIDIIDGKCVRLSQGDYDRCTVYKDTPADAAKRYVDAGFARIHVVDLDGAKASAPRNFKALEDMSRVEGAKIEWGGGLKSEQALTDIFNAGATYGIIGSLAAKNPQLMCELLREFGADRVVLGADVRGRKIAVNGWLEDTDMTVASLIELLRPAGLSQAICTEISRDGMFTGTACDLYTELMRLFPEIAFTASGGIGSMHDIEELDKLGVPRVIVGKALYEGKISLAELTAYAFPSQN